MRLCDVPMVFLRQSSILISCLKRGGNATQTVRESDVSAENVIFLQSTRLPCASRNEIK